MPAIDLAHESDFHIGVLAVRPSLREVAGPERAETIEPRVMQVLIALAGAAGNVVSRDDLTERCWGGRVVGDDAINRVIAKVRRVADGVGSGGFRLETVPKVGYRLVERSPARLEAMVPPAATPAHNPPELSLTRTRTPRYALVAVLGTIAAVGALLAHRPPPPVAPPVAIVAAPAQDLETRGLSAVFEGTSEQSAVGLGYLRQAATSDPGRASRWGGLAMGYVLSLPFAPEIERDGVVARIRESAARGLALDRHEGLSLAALTSLEPVFGHWAHHDAQLTRALAIAPRDTPPLQFQRAMFLAGVGRLHEAFAYEERLYAGSQVLPWIQAMRIDLLAANGRLDAAERMARHAGELFPRDREVWFARFDLAAFGGKLGTSRAMLADSSNWPRATRPEEMALAGETLRALETRAPADVNHVLAHYRRCSERGQGYAERAIRVAAALGRPTEALAFARRLYLRPLPPGPRSATMPRNGLIEPGERNTAPLFLVPAAQLWADPGFLPLMRAIGLGDYWRATRAPDFCGEPVIAPNCARLGLLRRTGSG